MADVTLYLHPGLATGSNDGSSEANAWQSWAACMSGLSSNYPDISASGSAESVDVIILGGSSTVVATLVLEVNCDATYPLRFVADPATRTVGVWDTGKPTLRFAATNDTAPCFNFSDTSGRLQYVEFEGLNFDWPQAYNGGTATGFFANFTQNAAGSRFVFDRCYFKGATATGSAFKVWFWGESNNGPFTAKNCVFADTDYSGSGAFYIVRYPRSASEGISEFYNCTFVNSLSNSSRFAEALSSGSARVTNCLFVNHGSSCDSGSFASGSGKNASTAASGLPGSDNTYDISSSGLFVDSGNYHLTSSNDWAAGPSDGTYGSYVPVTDIDGETRSGSTADAGADEYIASAPSKSMSYYYRTLGVT